MNKFKEFTTNNISNFESIILESISCLNTPSTLKESIAYSMKAGGKRIRPMLTFAVLESYGKDVSKGASAACAVELIHTYSLIHDDLPCMDDDDLRRGNPTNHKVFGEAMAILAGDAMQPFAFQLISGDKTLSADEKIALISELAISAGAEGMVGGQVADIEAEGKKVGLEHLASIHDMKTGKLILFSVVAGAILAGASGEDMAHLRNYAKHLGIAFQIQDDILDIEGDESQIGKPVGSDIENDKSTYPSLLTLDGAKEKLFFHIDSAKKSLNKVQCNHELLLDALEVVAKRNN